MKFTKSILFVSLLTLGASTAQARVEFQCYGLAVHVASKTLGYATYKEFLAENSEIWSCKSKKDPSEEEIQFGDGRGLIGVSLKIKNGKCIVKDVYTGQDDQDGDSSWDAENCLQ